MNKGDPSGSGASPDKPPRQGRTGRKSDRLIVLGGRESRGKRPAAGDSFWGDMGSIQREKQPSMQREDEADHGNGPGTNSSESAVNHLSKSVVRESRTPRSVGTGGGRPLPVTRSQGCNSPALLDLEAEGVRYGT